MHGVKNKILVKIKTVQMVWSPERGPTWNWTMICNFFSLCICDTSSISFHFSVYVFYRMKSWWKAPLLPNLPNMLCFSPCPPMPNNIVAMPTQNPWAWAVTWLYSQKRCFNMLQNFLLSMSVISSQYFLSPTLISISLVVESALSSSMQSQLIDHVVH